MQLAPGTRLGAYEIVGLVGAGGMGEVFRAVDARLDRHVALKVLPEAVASDPERTARFQREAKVLASLNHPNIATIHGLEHANGEHFIVMELVEGETLADRITHGPIPVEEALPIARQIAEALEAAHEQGVVHRDLKPANIKLRSDGTVKVLDFGLAKALAIDVGSTPGLTNSPTLTSPMAVTGVGVLLGTAPYMAPEQARGKAVDRRADIWAFGCVLFEMLAGARAFPGEELADIVGAVMKTEPDWKRLPDNTPAGINTLLRRCLRKDRQQRLADAVSLRIEIEDALTPSSAATPPRPVWQRAIPTWRAIAMAVPAIAMTFLIGAWWRGRPTPQPLNVARLTLPLPAGTELSDGASVVISPDGKLVAYAASRGGLPQLYLRAMDAFEARPVPGTAGAYSPFFSPDGQWLAFFADAKLKKISTSGGVVETLGDARAIAGTGSWGPNDTIVYRANPGLDLLEIGSEGGQPRRLLTPDPATDPSIQAAEFLPGGESLLLTTSGGATSGARIADENIIEVVTLASGARKVVVQGGSHPRYLPTGHLIFLRAGELMAVPFDLERLELRGSPVAVVKDVRQSFNGIGAFSCSRAGSCVYLAGARAAQRTVTLVDRAGTRQPLPLPPKNYSHPRFSPKGDKVLFWLEQQRCDIEVHDVARGGTTRITSVGDNHFPVWTPDGQQITYISRDSARTPQTPGYELIRKPANGGGVEEALSRSPLSLGPIAPLSWSRDGSSLAYADRGDIWLLPLAGEREPRRFLQSKFTETMPAFSPDGRWLAYVSDEAGRFDVYLQSVAVAGERHTISTDGGTEPVWAPTGDELFFRNGDQMMAVKITTPFNATRPRLLFTGSFARNPNRVNYDISPDGERFLMLNPGQEDLPATHISVLQNWFEELKRLVPTN